MCGVKDRDTCDAVDRDTPMPAGAMCAVIDRDIDVDIDIDRDTCDAVDRDTHTLYVI